MKEKIFLTGGTGFLGGHILINLYKKGYKIRALIRKSSSFEQLKILCKFYDITFDKIKNSVEWVYGNTLEYKSITENTEGIKEIYHCAGKVSFNDKNKEEIFNTNIKGTKNIINAALEKGIKNICYISSTSALGDMGNGEYIDEITPRIKNKRRSAYSESKFKAEQEVLAGKEKGLNIVIVNPGIILGPGDITKGSLMLIKTGTKGMPFYTNATTGYVDVRDVANICIRLMEKEIFGERFILTSENASYKKIFTLSAKEYGKPAPFIHAGHSLLKTAAFFSYIYGKITKKVPQLTKETIASAEKKTFYSNGKIKTALNYSFIPIEKTITDTCKLMKEDNKIFH